MSHGDTITQINKENMRIIGESDGVLAAYERTDLDTPVYGVQFHPEVYHSAYGSNMIANFLFTTCGCTPDSGTPNNFTETCIASIKEQLGDDRCIMAIS
jgi:GMP synthase (glutamine-hydrolysing)